MSTTALQGRLLAGDPAAAAQIAAASASAPDDVNLRFLLALAHLRDGRLQEAAAEAHQCLKLELGHAGALDVLDRIDAQPVVAKAPTISTVLEDRWEIFGRAHGGMGEVLFVRDRIWHRDLAVKSLRLDPLADPARVAIAEALFLREAQTWLDLGAHPHIVSAFFARRIDGVLRLFVEFVPGDSLAARIAASRLPRATALDLAHQLATAIEFVQARGMAHRDLKPENCMVTPAGELQLMDFGLSGLVTRADGTEQDFVAGTPMYMAPEQWSSLAASGPPVDVYAFGIVLWELLVGRRPFELDLALWQSRVETLPPMLRQWLETGSIEAEAVARAALRMFHEQVIPPRISEVDPAIAPILDEIVTRCLEKDPQNRPTATAIRAVLEQGITQAGGQPRFVSRDLGPTELGESNRAMSYEVMGHRKTAIEILDGWLANHPTALYPRINRIVLAAHEGARSRRAIREEIETIIRPLHGAALASDPTLRAFDGRVGNPLFPTAGLIGGAALTPDGTQLAILDEQLHLHDARTGAELLRIGIQGRGSCAAYLPDGELIVGGYKWAARLVNGALVPLVTRSRRITAIASGPNGFVLGGDEGLVERFDDASMTPAISWELKEWVHRVWCVGELVVAHATGRVFVLTPDGASRQLGDDQRATIGGSRDGRRIALAAEGQLVVWDVATAAPVGHFAVDGKACAVAVRDDGAELAVLRDDGTIAIVDLQRGTVASHTCIATADEKRDGSGFDLCYASGGHTLLAATWVEANDLAIHWWNVDGTLRERLGGFGDMVPLAVDASGFRAVNAHASSVEVWDLSEVERDWPAVIPSATAAADRARREAARDVKIAELAQHRAPTYPALRALQRDTPELARDTALVDALHGEGMTYGLRIGILDTWQTWSWSSGSHGLATLARAGTKLAVATDVAGVAILDLAGGTTTRTLAHPATPSPFMRLAMSADGRVATNALDGIRVFAANGEQVFHDPNLHGRVRFVGDSLLVATTTGALLIWAGGRTRVVAELPSEALAVAAFPDDQIVVVGSFEGQIDLVEVATGRIHGRLEHQLLRSIAVTPDGQLIVTAGWDKSIRLWNVADGRAIAMMRLPSMVESVDVSPDGQLLAVSQSMASPVIYRLGTGRVVARPRPGRPVSSAVFGADGHLLLVGWGGVQHWALDSDWVFLEDAHDPGVEDPRKIWARPPGMHDVGAGLRDLVGMNRLVSRPNVGAELCTVGHSFASKRFMFGVPDPAGGDVDLKTPEYLASLAATASREWTAFKIVHPDAYADELAMLRSGDNTPYQAVRNFSNADPRVVSVFNRACAQVLRKDQSTVRKTDAGRHQACVFVGTRLLACGDGLAWIDPIDGRTLARIEGRNPVSLDVSHDGTLVVAKTRAETFDIFTSDLRLLGTVHGMHAAPLADAIAVADERTIRIVRPMDPDTVLATVALQRPVVRLRGGSGLRVLADHGGGASWIDFARGPEAIWIDHVRAFARDGRRVLTVVDTVVKLLEPGAPGVHGSWAFPVAIRELVAGNDGRWIFAIDGTSFNILSPHGRANVRHEAPCARSLAIDPDGVIAITIDTQDKATSWSIASDHAFWPSTWRDAQAALERRPSRFWPEFASDKLHELAELASVLERCPTPDFLRAEQHAALTRVAATCRAHIASAADFELLSLLAPTTARLLG